MNRIRILVGFCVVCTLFSVPVFGQFGSWDTGFTKFRSNRGGGIFGDSSARHVGIFLVPRHRQQMWPSFGTGGGTLWGQVPRQGMGSGFFSRRGGYALSPYMSLYGRESAPKNYSSAKFVAEWKNREPVLPQRRTGLEDSLILSDGMSEADVIRVLGSPIQRVQMGASQVWKYSGYSLVFEDGILKGIR